ncbi:DUF3823 domain-containing protein [Prolixibacteraceae bacterium JC049]|nr:DUF3823 domain-containing protein [Prolixibacteraceae bacterium JC049]
MNKLYILLIMLFAGSCFTSCELDNQDAPKLTFDGTFVYNGKSVPVANNKISVKFYQDAFKLNDKFTATADQNGHFQNLVFPGDYKLVLETDKGAYENNTDTTKVSVTGNKSIEWPMKPFFFVTSANFTNNGNAISATANIEKVSDKEVEYVSLLVSKSIICDRINKDVEVKLTDVSDLKNVNLSATLSDWNRKYAFVRIGIKSNASSYYNYSEVVKVDL